MRNYQLSSDHYLSTANREGHLYYDGFKDAFECLAKRLSRSQLRNLESKLQLYGNGMFNEEQFVQIACETTVCAYFARKFPDTFKYELRCNSTNKTDVDCQFTDGKYTYNVEVKCPGLGNYKRNDKKSFKFEDVGRSDDESRRMSAKLLDIINESSVDGKCEWNYSKHKSLDNTMKTFLKEANKKFPSVELTDVVNILIVCCDDVSDAQRWMNYLYQQQGLFTNDSFCSTVEYDKLDIVIISNLLNRHYLFNSKNIGSDSWDLSEAFNLSFDNPMKDSINKDALLNFLYRFPHYSYFIADYIEEGKIKNIYEQQYKRAFCVMEIVPKLENLLSKINGESSRFFASWK